MLAGVFYTISTKYFGLDLQVFRLRQADLDRAGPAAHRPPSND